jgi:hypothetical protein
LKVTAPGGAASEDPATANTVVSGTMQAIAPVVSVVVPRAQGVQTVELAEAA